MFLKVSLVSIFICIALATQYVPIQNRYDGISQGDAGARLHIEAFYDLFCPDSKASNAILNQVFAQVDRTNIRFTVHIFPLPYHIEAFTAAIGVRFFEDKFDSNATFAYMNYVFDILDAFTGAATFNKTQSQVVQEFAQSVSDYFLQSLPQYKFTQAQFLSALSNGLYDSQARASWKFGCSRNIAGAPLFLVNGVIFDGAEEYQVQDWKDFIQARITNE